jgi:hypothetical protein
MLILDGRPLSYDRAFTHNEVQYPANWLRLASLEEKQAIGISEVADATWYDQRFYWGPELPKDHEGLVTLWIDNTNQTAYTLLAPSDWYVIRKQETETAVPNDVLDRRGEIRSFCDTKREAITSTKTTEELAAYITSASYSEWEVVLEASEQAEEPEIEDMIVVSGGLTLDRGDEVAFD